MIDRINEILDFIIKVLTIYTLYLAIKSNNKK